MRSIYQRQQDQGFRLLKFSDPLEAEYQAQLLGKGLSQLRFALIAAGLLGFALPAIDYVMGEPGFSSESILLRAILVQPIVCLMLAATFYRGLRPFLMAIGIVASLASAASILFLKTLGETHAIASGLPAYILITFFTYLFIGLRFWPALTTGSLAFAMYIVAGLYLGQETGAILYGAALLAVANLVAATGLYNIDYNRRMSFLREGELRFRASQDPLTGIANRGAFEDYFERAWKHCAREQIPIAIAMIDIDHFKEYNDHYGHPAGDQCLRAIAPIIEDSSQRPLDFAARYGGEEFVLLLPGCNTRRAKDIVNDLRRNVIASVIEHTASPTSALLTVSAGVSSLMPKTGVDDRDELIRLADDALYKAKSDGRNRVVAAEESLADSRLAKVIRLADIRKESTSS